MWSNDLPHNFRVTGTIRTNLVTMTVLDGSLLLHKHPYQKAQLKLGYNTATGHRADYLVKAERRNKLVSAELLTPVEVFGTFKLDGTLTEESPTTHSIVGKMMTINDVYNIDGSLKFTANDDLTEATLRLIPAHHSEPVATLTCTITDPDNGYGKLMNMKIRQNDHFVNVGAELSMFSKINWKLFVNMQTSPGIMSRDQTMDNRFDFTTVVQPSGGGRILGRIDLKTPWRHLGIDAVKATTNFTLFQSAGDVYSSYDIGRNHKGHTSLAWTFRPNEDIRIGIYGLTERSPHGPMPRTFSAGIRYHNNGVLTSSTKDRQAHTLEAQMNVNSRWLFESNDSVTVAPGDRSGFVSLRLPSDPQMIHRITGRFRGDLETISKHVFYDVQYEQDEVSMAFGKRYSSLGEYRNGGDDVQGVLRAAWGRDVKSESFEANVQVLPKGDVREFSGRLHTPMHFNEDTVRVNGSFGMFEAYSIGSGQIFYPETNKIAEASVTFESISNMKGLLNCTTPYKNLTWLHGDFEFKTTG